MAPTSKRRRPRRRSDAKKARLALGGVVALLVAVNIYVFFVRPGNVADLRRKVEQNRISHGPGTLASPEEIGVAGAPAAPVKAPVLPRLGGPFAPRVDGDAAGAGGGPDRGAGAGAEAPPTGRAVDGKIGRGDTLSEVLEREGLTRPEAGEILKALDGVLDMKGLREGQAYVLRLDDEGRVTAFELRVSPAVLVRVERDADGKLVAQKTETKTELQVQGVSGTITSSLYDAIKGAGESTELVADLADLFAGDLNFYVDTHDGDSFALVVEKLHLDGKFWKYGRILAAEYRGKAGRFRAFYYQVPGAPRGAYFDDEGRSTTRSLLKTPLKFARMSSGFNPRRMHPVLHRVKGHFGTDYAAPTGTPVWASSDGRVANASPSGGAGNLVVLDHGGGLRTYYMHLSRFAKGLAPGQHVAQKQIIGYVGTTGLSTGPHLHFGVQQNGKWIDPAKLTPRRAAPVPPKAMAAFKDGIAPHLAALDRLAAAPTGGRLAAEAAGADAARPQ